MTELELENDESLENAKKEYISDVRHIKKEMDKVKIEVTEEIEKFKSKNGILLIVLLLYSSIITVFISENVIQFGEDFIICVKAYFKCIHILLEFCVDNLFRQVFEFSLSTILHIIYGIGSILLIAILLIPTIVFYKTFYKVLKRPEWAIANIMSLSVLCSIGERVKAFLPLNLFVAHCLLVIPIAVLIAKLYILPEVRIFSLISNFIESEINRKL
ncbi:MAG: hypothetical protein IJC05_00295 [Phascolarctobacterium sp.]|nr:hypothetical protein [Phascolarctobacterium sp.]